jgi:hypothetical protein
MGFDLGQLAGQVGGYAGGLFGGGIGGTGGLMGGVGKLLGTNSTVPGYQVDPNAYQYGGHAGGADEAQQAYEKLGQQLQSRQGATIDQSLTAEDRFRQQQLMGQEGGLAKTFQDQMSGKAPSLAESQMKAATDQSIASQMAMARSQGGAGAALGARNAANMGSQMQMGAAQQSMIGRIQEEQNAAQNLSGLYGQIGGQGQGLMVADAQQAAAQAALNQQQYGLNNQALMGLYGMGQQAQMAQLTAQGAGQQAGLEATGQQMGQGEANAANNVQMLKSIAGGVSGGAGAGAGAAAAGDLHMVDPRHGGPTWTIREEPHFMAVRRPSGRIEELQTKPLSEAHRLELQSTPHGAGPLRGTNVSQPGVPPDGVVHDARPGDLGFEGMGPDLGEQGMVNQENDYLTQGNVAGLAASPGYDQGWDSPEAVAAAKKENPQYRPGAGANPGGFYGAMAGYANPDEQLNLTPHTAKPGMPGFHPGRYAYDLHLGRVGRPMTPAHAVAYDLELGHTGGYGPHHPTMRTAGHPGSSAPITPPMPARTNASANVHATTAGANAEPHLIAHDLTLDSSFGGGSGEAVEEHSDYDLYARAWAAMHRRFGAVPPRPSYAHMFAHDLPLGAVQPMATRPPPMPMIPRGSPAPMMQPRMMGSPTPQMMNQGAQALQQRAMALRGVR